MMISALEHVLDASLGCPSGLSCLPTGQLLAFRAVQHDQWHFRADVGTIHDTPVLAGILQSGSLQVKLAWAHCTGESASEMI